MTKESLAKRLVRLRKLKSLSQLEVARMAHIPPSTYRDWEYGKQIKGEPYSVLAEVLGVTVTELLTGVSPESDILISKIDSITSELQELRRIALSL